MTSTDTRVDHMRARLEVARLMDDGLILITHYLDHNADGSTGVFVWNSNAIGNGAMGTVFHYGDSADWHYRCYFKAQWTAGECRSRDEGLLIVYRSYLAQVDSFLNNGNEV